MSTHIDPESTSAPIAVIGATGKTGRRVTERLARHGVALRPLSRRSAVPFDWERPTTWPAALDGIRAAYVTYQPDLSVPAAAQALTRLVEVGRSAGVERLVLLSGRREQGAQRCEEIVMAALPRSTVLTCSWFAQNFSEGVLRDSVASGVIALPADPGVREPFLDADDIAATATTALLDGHLAGSRLELTGPASLTFDEVAEALTVHVGRPVSFVPVTAAEFVAGATAAGVPAEQAAMLSAVFAEVLDGRNAHTTEDVAKALGRPARTFDEFARDAAAAGAWREPASGSVQGHDAVERVS